MRKPRYAHISPEATPCYHGQSIPKGGGYAIDTHLKNKQQNDDM